MRRHRKNIKHRNWLHPASCMVRVGVLLCLVLVSNLPRLSGAVKIHRAEEETSRSYTWNIADQPENFPDWLRELPVPRGVTGGRRDFQLIPPKNGGNLAVTLFFDEPEQGHLRVSFRNPDYGQVLSDNLFEGTALPNQRTVVLDERVLYRPGVLSLLCSEPELPVWRIRFQWLMPSMVLTPSGPGEDAPAAMLPSGELILSSEMPVSRRSETEDEWEGENFTAVLLADIERLDGGLEIGFELEKVPQMAVLNLQLAGVPLEGTVWLWFGERGAVPVHLALPSSKDGGYRLSGVLDGEPRFAGWRAGTAFVPQRLLREGLNLMRFQFLDAGGAHIKPAAAVRDVSLDVRFEMERAEVPPSASHEVLPENSPELTGEGLFYEDFSLDLFDAGTPAPAPAAPAVSGIRGWNPVPLPGADFVEPKPGSEDAPSQSPRELPVETLGDDLAPVLQEFLDEHWNSASDAGQ